MTSFSGTTIVASYAENAARMVPGLRGLPKMARALLPERVSTDAHILVLGAGGGLDPTCSNLRNPVAMQSLRYALRKPDDGHGVGVEVRCVEQYQIAGLAVLIERVDREIAIILAVATAWNEDRLARDPVAEIVANHAASLGVDLHHRVESGRRRPGQPQRVNPSRSGWS